MHYSRTREAGERSHGRRALFFAANRTDFGQPEVENLSVPAAGDEQIGRLDIAVNDPGGVRRFQRVGDLDRERQEPIDLERAPGDPMLQRHPVEELHDEERAAALLADVVDGADVGVVQRRGGPCLAAESGQRLGITSKVGRQELQRDEALQARILGLVHDTHAAAAELLDDAVVRERLTDQGVAAGPDVVAAAPSGELACGQIDRRSAEKRVGAVVRLDQRADFVLQLLVAAAGAPQKHVAIRRGKIQRRLQQLIDVIPAFLIHSQFRRSARDRARLSRSSIRASQ